MSIDRKRMKAIEQISKLANMRVRTVEQYLTFSSKTQTLQKKYEGPFDNKCTSSGLIRLECCDAHRTLKSLFEKLDVLNLFFDQEYDVQTKADVGSKVWLDALKKAANVS